MNRILVSVSLVLLSSGLLGAKSERPTSVWKERTQLRDLKGIGAVSFSPKGTLIATCSPRDGVKVRSMSDGQERFARGGQAAVFSPDGKWLAVADKSVQLIDLASEKVCQEWAVHSNSLCFSPDSRILAASSETVILSEIKEGKEIRLDSLEDWQCRAVSFSDDGKHVLSVGTIVRELKPAWQIKRWDLATRKAIEVRDLSVDDSNPSEQPAAPKKGAKGIRLLGEETDLPRHFAISPDGRALALAIGKHNVRLVEISKPHVPITLPQSGPAKAISFSPDGKTLAIGVDDDKTTCEVVLWETTTAKQRTVLPCHQRPQTKRPLRPNPEVSSLVYSADGRSLAWARSEGIAVWERKVVQSQEPVIASDKLWNDLADPEAAVAYRAMQELAATKEMIDIIKQRLPVAKAVAAEAIVRLVRDLGHESFEVRSKALRELEQLGGRAESVLRKELARPDGDVQTKKSVEKLLDELGRKNVGHPDRLRLLRVVEVLEGVGTPAALQLLEHYAKGDPQAELTKEAERALQRLRRTPNECHGGRTTRNGVMSAIGEK